VYGYTEKIELTEIVGAELMWLNLGHYIFQLIFSNELRLTIKNDVSLARNGTELCKWSDYRWSSAAFQALLGKAVTSYSVVSRDELKIQFADGYALTLYDDPQYESLEIWPANRADDKSGPFVV
jgi:Family of unknown function (DUF6188)